METRFCDWHTHSNFSKDSPLSIQEYFEDRLPRVIRDISLAGVSITDHNTLDAYTIGEAEDHLQRMNSKLGTRVKLLLGTELSLDVKIGYRKQHFHFLLYHPNTEGGLDKTAKMLQQGLLGELMDTIVAQNNKRHWLMAEKAARYLQLRDEEAKALHILIKRERGLSREVGREHLKRTISIIFPGLKEKVDVMFSRQEKNAPYCCHVETGEVEGFDAPYLPTLEALTKEYRKGMIVLAHPWRYDSGFEFADKNKEKDGLLVDMSKFIPDLASRRLIKGIEIYGHYPIPVKIDMHTGRRFRVKHVRYTGTTYQMIAIKNGLICTEGNDSHGEELEGGKPDIPIGYGCRETDPQLYHMTGIRHTPPRPIPAIGIQSR